MLSDLSSRIKRAKERLALTQEKEERLREQMAQQAAEAGTGINKVITTNDYGELKSLSQLPENLQSFACVYLKILFIGS